MFLSVSKRSGYSTIRLWLSEDEHHAPVEKWFTQHQCLVQLASNFSNRLIALGFALDTFEELHHITSKSERRGWEHQVRQLSVPPA